MGHFCPAVLFAMKCINNRLERNEDVQKWTLVTNLLCIVWYQSYFWTAGWDLQRIYIIGNERLGSSKPFLANSVPLY